MEKTATDQTSKRSSKTKPSTIQPPPLTGIFEVPVSGSLLAREPENVIRQATRWQVAEADQGRNEQRLVDDLGATVVKLSDDQLAAMAAKVRADVWPQVLEDVGADWGQAILDKVAASN